MLSMKRFPFLATVLAMVAINNGCLEQLPELPDGAVIETDAAVDQEFKVEIISPSSGATYTVGDDVVVTVRATDDRPIIKVDGYHNEGSNPDVWFDKVEGSHDDDLYTLVWENVPTAGEFILHAVGTNADNVPMDSNDVTIRVAALNQSPTCRMTWPRPPGPVTFYPSLEIWLRAASSDPDGTVANVKFYEGAQLLGTVTATSSHEPDWVDEYLLRHTFVAGAHTVYAVCTDNQGATSTSETVPFTVTAPEPLAITDFQVPSPVTVGQQAGASWQTTGVVVNNIIIGACWITGGPFGTYNIPSNAAVSGTTHVTATQAGTFQVTLHCRRGNEPEVQLPRTLVVNPPQVNNPPTCTITAPLNNATFVVGAGGTASVPVSGTATDSDINDSVARVEFHLNGVLVGTDFNSPYALSSALNLGVGTHSIMMRCYDTNNVFGQHMVSVTVNPQSQDHLPVANNDSAVTQLNTAVTISVLANDTGLEDGGLTVTVTDPPRGSATVSGNNVIYMPDNSLSGADSFQYTVRDADGDQAMATVTVNVIVPNQPLPCSNLQMTLDNQSQVNQMIQAGQQIQGWPNSGPSIFQAAPTLMTVNTPNGVCATTAPMGNGQNHSLGRCSGTFFPNDSMPKPRWTTTFCPRLRGHTGQPDQAGCTFDGNCELGPNGERLVVCLSWPSAPCWPNQVSATQ